MDSKKINFQSKSIVYDTYNSYMIRNTEKQTNNSGAHYHDFYEVQVYTCDAGEVRFKDSSYMMRRGDILFVNIFTQHQFVPVMDKFDRYNIGIEPKMLLGEDVELNNMVPMFTKNGQPYRLIHVQDDLLEALVNVFDRTESMSMEHGGEIMRKALMYEFMALLYNHAYKGLKISKVNARHINVVADLVHYVERHLDEDLSLDSLERQMRCSQYHLCRVFKQYTGFTVNKYVTTKRLEKAEALLYTDASIQEASVLAGFHNYSHFFKVFKSYHGLGPNEYKELYCRTEDI